MKTVRTCFLKAVFLCMHMTSVWMCMRVRMLLGTHVDVRCLPRCLPVLSITGSFNKPACWFWLFYLGSLPRVYAVSASQLLESQVTTTLIHLFPGCWGLNTGLCTWQEVLSPRSHLPQPLGAVVYMVLGLVLGGKALEPCNLTPDT